MEWKNRRINNLQQAKRAAVDVYNRLEAGGLSENAAKARGYLLNLICNILKESEIQELANRLAEIEERLNHDKS